MFERPNLPSDPPPRMFGIELSAERASYNNPGGRYYRGLCRSLSRASARLTAANARTQINRCAPPHVNPISWIVDVRRAMLLCKVHSAVLTFVPGTEPRLPA